MPRPGTYWLPLVYQISKLLAEHNSNLKKNWKMMKDNINRSKNLNKMSKITWKQWTRSNLILSKCWKNQWNWTKFCKRPFPDELNDIWNRTPKEFLAKRSMKYRKPKCNIPFLKFENKCCIFETNFCWKAFFEM